jgi:hypothetical protein
MIKPSRQEADFPIAEDMGELPSDIATPLPATGTVDDDDNPADERADENEAPVRERSENTSARAEFERDDEDRNQG